MLSAMQCTLQGYCLEVDYCLLRDGTGSADLVAAFEMQPMEGLACVGAAVHEVLTNHHSTCIAMQDSMLSQSFYH